MVGAGDGMGDDVLRGEILQLVSRFSRSGIPFRIVDQGLTTKKDERNTMEKVKIVCIDCFLASSAPPGGGGGVEDNNWIYIQTHRAAFRRFLKDGRFYLDSKFGPLRYGSFPTHLIRWRAFGAYP